jgi:hypothetical protein
MLHVKRVQPAAMRMLHVKRLTEVPRSSEGIFHGLQAFDLLQMASRQHDFHMGDQIARGLALS